VMSGGQDYYLVFRPLIATGLVSQRRRDLNRTVQVVPNRIPSILFWTDNDTDEGFDGKCVGYTPWYPPDEAVQLFLGGPAYANDYRSANTRRISPLKDFRNKYCKFIFFIYFLVLNY